MVESSSADILMPSAAERFITTPHLCTEIIEDSLPRMADSGRTDLRTAVRADLAQQVADTQAHLEATRERLTASPAAIMGQPLTGGPRVTEPSRVTGDSLAADELSLDADRARRALVVSTAAVAVSRADPIRMEHRGVGSPAVRMVADTLAAGMPVVDMPAVDTAAVEVTVAADTAASAKCPG